MVVANVSAFVSFACGQHLWGCEARLPLSMSKWQKNNLRQRLHSSAADWNT